VAVAEAQAVLALAALLEQAVAALAGETIIVG
jgi:hypothetical protein